MASAGVPGALLPLVIALEVLGAIAIIVGYRTRLVAAGLAVFSIASGVLFHGGSDPMQQVMLLKNLAIAGGFLFLVAHGAGDWSLDARRVAGEPGRGRARASARITAQQEDQDDITNSRKFQAIIESVAASDGAGVKLRRSLGSRQNQRFDPFLMLDEFFSDDPDDYLAGFPSHPHRGFETVTYMIDGHMRHEDNFGTAATSAPATCSG